MSPNTTSPTQPVGKLDSAQVFAAEFVEIRKRRKACGQLYDRESTERTLSGIALSGGGVRSATFALGVTQSLVSHGLLSKLDYLSTVSGGGYLGAYISSWFRKYPNLDLPIRSDLGKVESTAIRRLRDFASYLAPQGRSNGLTFIALLALGFSINLILILPVLILFGLLFSLFLYISPAQYPITITLMLFSGWAILYGLFISTTLISPTKSRPRTVLLGITQVLFMLAATFLFIQLQAPAVYAIHGFSSDAAAKIYYAIAGSFGAVGVALAAMRGVFDRFATLVNRFWRIALGLAAPLILWYIVLLIEITLVYPCSWLYLQEPVGVDILELMRPYTKWLGAEQPIHCETIYKAYNMGEWDVLRIAGIYGIVAALILLLSLFINVNSTSLHTFYRDRLADAYIFSDAKDSIAKWFSAFFTRLLPGRVDATPISTESVRLSTLSNAGPYHIINAAINLQSSSENMRGRNAQIFTFSRLHMGSAITGYCPTALLEETDRQLDLATATAVSGAALAPNQGLSTNRALRFLMALANARLGYWMVNPSFVAQGIPVSRKVSPYYFFLELFGWLDEKRHRIYVSDGGHIENLGVYELLSRKCRYIIICDAECDPKMTFHGLSHLIRLARIDFQYEIDINLLNLRAGKDLSQVHCAIGIVRYSENLTGRILYIKPSLTGDEAEYLHEYRSRSPAFPHEPTADQFFTEEQFEAYRRLGEHIADELFSGEFEGWEKLFVDLERKFRPRPVEETTYFAIQAAITKLAEQPQRASAFSEDASQSNLGSYEFRARKQMEIVEAAVSQLRLYSRDMATGPYRNLVHTFRKWIAEEQFESTWQTLRLEFSAEAQAFVDELRAMKAELKDGALEVKAD